MQILKTGASTTAMRAAFVALVVLGVLVLSFRTSNPQHAAEGYAQRHLFDPIYAFPGTDISRLTEALSAFELSAKAAVPMFPEDASAKESVYPFRFLAVLPKTEAARRLLIAEPTAIHARKYHKELRALLAVHAEDLRRADAILSADTNSNVFRYFSGENSVNSVRETLQEAQEANAAAVKKEERRFACFEGVHSSCESLTLLRLRFGKIYPQSGVRPIPQSVEENREALAVLYPHATSSPIFVLDTPACVPVNPAYYALAFEPSRLSGIQTVQTLYLNELYVERTASSTHPFYILLSEAGVSFTYQPISAYLCPEYGSDVGVVLGMHALRESLSTHPITLKGFTSAALRDTQSAAAAFTLESTLQENKYHAFLNAALRTIRSEDGARLARTLGGRSELIRLAEYATAARAGSSHLELVVGYFDDLQVGSYIPYRLNPTPPSAFLITRGGLSQLYALDNETVVPHTLSLLGKKNETSELSEDPNIPIHPLTQGMLRSVGVTSASALFEIDIKTRKEVFSGFISELLSTRAEKAATSQ